MAPTIQAGDNIVMENLTFRARRPRRGDVVVFKTDGISELPSGQIFVRRVVGEPGEQVRISAGRLYVNNESVTLSNAAGEIRYAQHAFARYLTSDADTFTVTANSYFLLGDNSANSMDSRFWGSVPAGNILGMASLIYWPWLRRGGIK